MMIFILAPDEKLWLFNSSEIYLNLSILTTILNIGLDPNPMSFFLFQILSHLGTPLLLTLQRTPNTFLLQITTIFFLFLCCITKWLSDDFS